MKRCSKCKVEKPLEEFGRNKRSKDGRQNYCKLCMKAYNSKWRGVNKDYRKAHYEENKERQKANVARWRKENRDKVRGYQARYYAKNREKYSAYQAKYRAENREQFSDKDFNAHIPGQLQSPDLFIEFVSRWKVFERDNWTCGICGEPIPQDLPPDQQMHPRYPTVDHIHPLSKGGEHSYANCQAAHRGCNSAKRDRVGPGSLFFIHK